MRNLLISLLFFVSLTVSAQELNCSVIVNAQQTGNQNLQVFKTLERQLNEFVNKTQWTRKTFTAQERIDCSMVITITEFESERFGATIQVQSSRPVFGSSYSSPVYNYNDKDFNFQYVQFERMVFNPSQFESNLISVISFHIYMILGIDADSFAPNGGDEYYKQAQAIVNYSQQENAKGWKLEDGLQSRYMLIDNILSPTYKEYRQTMYNYHREGMDIMSDNVKQGKTKVAESLMQLQAMHGRRPNSFLMRTFFDAKADEISDVFSEGPTVNISDLVDLLNRIAPIHSDKWRNIKL